MSTDRQKQEASIQAGAHGTFLSYCIGFIASIALTLLAFYLVTSQVLSGTALMLALAGLAVIQLVVQLVFFLHLSLKPRSRSSFYVFLFMLLTAVIIAFGSVWIMNNLDYETRSTQEVIEYMNRNLGF